MRQWRYKDLVFVFLLNSTEHWQSFLCYCQTTTYHWPSLCYSAKHLNVKYNLLSCEHDNEQESVLTGSRHVREHTPDVFTGNGRLAEWAPSEPDHLRRGRGIRGPVRGGWSQFCTRRYLITHTLTHPLSAFETVGLLRVAESFKHTR